LINLQLLGRWLRGHLLGWPRLIEGTALLVILLSVAAIAIPLWLLFDYRPDRDHPVNRLLLACQEGGRRGALGFVGLGAGGTVVLWGIAVVSQLVWRGVRDIRAMQRFGRELAGSRRSSFLAGGVRTDVFLMPERVAFTVGLFRPRVYLGAGLVAALQPPESEAVLLHERHHVVRYDPLRCWLVELALAIPLFKPGRSLAAYYRASREAEADRAAVESQGDDRPLLTALRKADRLQTVAGACGLSPERQKALREVRHLEARLRLSDTVALAFALSMVFGLLILTAAGLTDWQWYWFCPDQQLMPK
jgi:Zn-dependent protease with chaperone function